jgi:hypothetical protein
VSPAGGLVVSHRVAPRGAHRTVRLAEHTAALEKVVLGAFNLPHNGTATGPVLRNRTGHLLTQRWRSQQRSSATKRRPVR